MTQRQQLIDKLTPSRRYQAVDPGLVRMNSGRYLFAATDTNAGYFLITDERGQLAPLDTSVLGQLVQEAKLYGVKLKNMRIFGSQSLIKRVPADGRFYGVERLVEASC
ncbi:hypothetical protein N799_05195 [Lysobacter arseniciresistens ZS79]|uniref:Uncharacterized protein n=1 Tax=Lysobacter arseniciresistens ZS79 TaxID=913325 RepID=A0A0A0F4N1_9GAMM|nr:hypothetical protein [Lysobacter arseniciresistens]KGM57470.1 hypothetical protein N799_05195 [Lysobacter arseniciresistens ZS79]